MRPRIYTDESQRQNRTFAPDNIFESDGEFNSPSQFASFPQLTAQSGHCMISPRSPMKILPAESGS